MIFRIVFILYVVLVLISAASASTYLEKDTLLKDILNGYNTDILPLQNQSDRVDVSTKLTIYTVTDIDPIKGLITLTIGFDFRWTDEIIQWNSSDYGGIENVLLPPERIWKPSVSLVSSQQPIVLGEDNNERAHVYSNGLTFWKPSHFIKLSCSFYMKFWPFDKQACDIIMLVNGDTPSNVKLNVENPRIETSTISMSEWILEDKELLDYDPPYVSIVVFRLKFKRQPVFYVLTLILPIALIGILSPFVFLLPSNSGERIGFSITIMLSLIVFLTVISDEIPRTTDPVALICGYVMLLILSSVLVTILTIINLTIHHRSDKETVGLFWRTVFMRKQCFNRNRVQNERVLLNQDGVVNSTISDHEMKIIEIADIEKKLNDTCLNITIEQADDECSWQDVSEAIDKYLFFITSVLVMIPSIVFICYLSIASDYYLKPVF